MVRFLLSGTPGKTLHTYNRAHTHESLRRHTSTVCATTDKHTTHRCVHTMEEESVITKLDSTESFCWSEHQGTDFYLWPRRAIITSKEKLILNQLLI